jgi:hypothetical protein
LKLPPDQEKKMTKVKLLTLSLFAFLPISTAFAADPLNMIGTWVGVANVAVLGVTHTTTPQIPRRFVLQELNLLST